MMAHSTATQPGQDTPAVSSRYAEYISQALITPGGHLALGHGGVTLYFGDSRLSGCLPEHIKAEAIAAGLPVIDSRAVPFDLVCALAVRGPMAAVNRQADTPPWHALSFAPLEIVADAYRVAGAEVHNLEPMG